MHLHIRIHHWVVGWLFLGVVLGTVAIINILFRDLSRTQERMILTIGALNWLLGGLICYGYGGIRIDRSTEPAKFDKPVRGANDGPTEWHATSDFVFPGGRKSLLPPKY
jgi:hypothetical protein